MAQHCSFFYICIFFFKEYFLNENHKLSTLFVKVEIKKKSWILLSRVLHLNSWLYPVINYLIQNRWPTMDQNYQEIKDTFEPICKNDDHSSLPILKNISYLEISWYLIQSLIFLPPDLKISNDEINFNKIFYSFREKSWRGCDFPQKLCCRRVQVNRIFVLVFCFK